MTVCRERQGDLSPEAEACPHCGIPNMDESTRPADVGGCLFLFIGPTVLCSLGEPVLKPLAALILLRLSGWLFASPVLTWLPPERNSARAAEG